MEIVHLLCKSLNESPLKNKSISTWLNTPINTKGMTPDEKEKAIKKKNDKKEKAIKDHVNVIQGYFDQLPSKVQHIAINETLKTLLYPKGKNIERQGIAYSLFQLIFVNRQLNKNNNVWKHIVPKLKELKPFYIYLEDSFNKISVPVSEQEVEVETESENECSDGCIKSSTQRIGLPVKPKRKPTKLSRKKPVVKPTIKPKRKPTKLSRKKPTKPVVKRKPTKPSRNKKFDKVYQTRETLEEYDPLNLYYISLYSENPKSEVAILWLIKYGMLDGIERKNLEKKFEKIKKK